VLPDHAALTLTGVLLLVTLGGALLLVASALLVRLVLRMRSGEPTESLDRPWMTDNQEKGDTE
jgi:hypothetical protein